MEQIHLIMISEQRFYLIYVLREFCTALWLYISYLGLVRISFYKNTYKRINRDKIKQTSPIKLKSCYAL